MLLLSTEAKIHGTEYQDQPKLTVLIVTDHETQTNHKLHPEFEQSLQQA
jgi:hypothetical protein